MTKELTAEQLAELKPLAGVIETAIRDTPIRLGTDDWGTTLAARVLVDVAAYMGRVVSTEVPVTIYRASYDGSEMGLYTSREAARAHCETLLRREVGEEMLLGWVPDHGGGDAPEELCTGHDVECSGYWIAPVTVQAAFQADAEAGEGQ
ncbi:hypothetical protein [Streptomyces sp. UH6]|uniref:hypothetical protein n=1 Tax=Streptomyces sp. UH6 TaxID=2748379 RepID=UPI0015D46ECD|nr:hypothetical protein [Streptomyces sp. UH6]NYV73656.1 hypothetical protein [Streptomyces sp. UH6]